MQDPPYHGRLRGLVTRAFTSAMLARVESYTRDVTERLMEGMFAKASSRSR
jgi:cytochrome P450